MARGTDTAECSIPIQGWTGVGNSKQDGRFKASIARPPLIRNLDASHVAKLKCQEVHPVFCTNLISELGDPHLGAGSVIWAHRLAVRMAIDQKSIATSRVIRLAPG